MIKRVAYDMRTFYATDMAQVRMVDDDVRRLRFLLLGSQDTPYAGGRYVFEMALPASFPFDPPTITFLTPSGRFEVGTPICTTFSAHHAESWSIAHTLSTLVISVLSFMNEESDGRGSLSGSASERAELAAVSAAFNASKGYAALFD